MEMTNTTRALIARAADQIIRQLSRTTVADLALTGAAHATPWVSVDVRLGNAGGVRYVRAALGLKEAGYGYDSAPGLIEAVAKDRLDEAHRIVERIIERAVAGAFSTGEWKRAG